jgi:hypothetical protein
MAERAWVGQERLQRRGRAIQMVRIWTSAGALRTAPERGEGTPAPLFGE